MAALSALLDTRVAAVSVTPFPCNRQYSVPLFRRALTHAPSPRGFALTLLYWMICGCYVLNLCGFFPLSATVYIHCG